MTKHVEPTKDTGDRPVLEIEKMAKMLLPYVERMLDPNAWMYEHDALTDNTFRDLVTPKEHAIYLAEVLYQNVFAFHLPDYPKAH